jgi:glycosyltransferase involved in cell wall biosynthesis
MINYLVPDFNDTPNTRTSTRQYVSAGNSHDEVDISIITPYYNTGEIFMDTFLSIKLQSLQNWEWIVIDDGSPDPESVATLQRIVQQDARIKIIRQDNGGTAKARNTGFRHSTGRYIFLLDHDDMVEPTYLEKCVWFLDSYPEFAFCNSYSVVFGQQSFLWTTGFERNKAFLQANSGPPISVIRRTAYAECGGFDESIRVLYEDWDFWLAMAKSGYWGYTIPEFLQWYRKLGSGRYEQILQSGYVNEEFASAMQKKYVGLDKCFPEPTRRLPQAFELIETISLVSNPLVNDASVQNILFVVPWMVTGGADRVNLDLVEGLTARGHNVSICATLRTDHLWEHEFSKFTPDIFILPNFLHISDYPRFVAYLISSRAITTVVISGSTLGYQLLPYLRAVSPEVAFVDLSHVEELHWLNGGHPRFGVGYQDALDLNVVTTQHLANWMQALGADGSRIKVMYTGVRSTASSISPDVKNLIQSELGLPRKVPVIVFAGRLCAQKRPELLIEILKLARDQGLDFQALIIGDGELTDRVKQLHAKYQLSNQVQILGAVSHKRWLEILSACDILLMPSQYEGISIALLEAIAAGVVPVVANVGGQNEIVQPDVGILIDQGPDETKSYVDALHKLLSSDEVLRQMSVQCKRKSETDLSWNGMIDNFLKTVGQAHQLKLNTPRNAITPNFGRELASQALEYNRLNETIDWLWHAKQPSATGSAVTETTTNETREVVKLAMILSSTRIGRAVIRNRFLKAMGKRLLRRLGK